MSYAICELFWGSIARLLGFGDMRAGVGRSYPAFVLSSTGVLAYIQASHILGFSSLSAAFQVDVGEVVDGLPAKNVNAEKVIRVAKNAMLGKVGREGAETLAIARFDPLEGYIEERNRIVNKLYWLWLGVGLKVDEG